MKKFKLKITAEIAAITIIILLCFGLLIGKLLLYYYDKSVMNHLKEEGQLVTLYLGDADNGNDLEMKSNKLNNHLRSSFLIMNKEGRILYKTDKPSGWKNWDDSASLTEYMGDIRTDKQIGKKSDIRTGPSYYYMDDYSLDTGETGHFILVSNEDSSLYTKVWFILLGCLGFACVMIVLFVFQLIKKFAIPIESATKAALELTRGNYRARSYVGRNNENGILNHSINTVARNLQEMKIAHEIQKDRLSTLIENMGSALLLIDDKGFISMINHAYIDLFKVEEEEYLSELYYKVIKHEEINAIIEEIFMAEQKLKKQIVLTIGIERKNFEVYGAPIMGPKGEWKGILLVFHDITELKKLESVRKQFVANVSHELNTPVTSIKGFSETLLDGAMHDPQALEHFLSIILKESDRLQALIKELLELSKVEQQGFRLDIQEIDIVPVLSDTYAMLEKKASKKHIQFEIQDFKKPIMCEADTFRLKQVCLNLVSNAISYTPSYGKVQITAKEESDKIYIAIEDTGIGIEEKEFPRIFERFYRVDKDRSRESGGTGLGLAIAKHIMEAHEGEITVESQKNVGTTFTIILPKYQAKHT
ncbi:MULTISPECIES: two-component system histidine kinase PnpS [unclassified Bacillus (in: firmicutes)]|uniref:two-component system histidine kinase PnpS n=1 Tax=unclassified Bacillus (in: firmicutes) TaxID=185979 RepID=UPI00080AC5A2|nr:MULTISPECIES: HAMP domain-containing sensor histidine kinase [unclassified Bacillus (in: firmicutes)]OCA81812.1 hypothetical protein A8L44_14515 [Bacillus sp. FJAT-27986]